MNEFMGFCSNQNILTIVNMFSYKRKSMPFIVMLCYVLIVISLIWPNNLKLDKNDSPVYIYINTIQ